MAVTLFAAVSMALGARQAFSVVDRGADDLARWIDVPLVENRGASARAPRTSLAGGTQAHPTQKPQHAPTVVPSSTRPPAKRQRAAPRRTPTRNTKTSVFAPAFPKRLPIRFDAPSCDGVSAYIVSVFEDSKDSVTTLSTSPEQQGRQRHVGQKFGDYRVVKIAYNTRRMSCAVWLADGSHVCQVMLRDQHPVRKRLQRSGTVRRAVTRAKALRQRKAQIRARKRKRR